jgi:adenylate cyclase class 2
VGSVVGTILNLRRSDYVSHSVLWQHRSACEELRARHGFRQRYTRLRMPRLRTVREIEVKLRISDPPALLAKVSQLRARCHGRVFERNTLYDTPNEDFRRAGRLLRLRIETPAPVKGTPGGARKAVFTSKAPAPGSPGRYKEKLEREAIVRSPAKWPPKLRALGFRPGFCYEKCRTTFRLAGLRLELDETPVGTFLELEGAPRAIDRTARALGFFPRDYIRGTYWDLFQATRRGRAHPPQDMTFRARNSRKSALLP